MDCDRCRLRLSKGRREGEGESAGEGSDWEGFITKSAMQEKRKKLVFLFLWSSMSCAERVLSPGSCQTSCNSIYVRVKQCYVMQFAHCMVQYYFKVKLLPRISKK